jgi:hypothetical protein
MICHTNFPCPVLTKPRYFEPLIQQRSPLLADHSWTKEDEKALEGPPHAQRKLDFAWIANFALVTDNYYLCT